MSMASSNVDAFCSLGKEQLLKLKTKAMRSGAWFKMLRRIDRVLLDLTIRVVDKIRSVKLAKSINVLAKKLAFTTRQGFSSRLSEIGLPLAQKISFAAEKLGNPFAKSWAFDHSFVFFLAVLHVNAVNAHTSGNNI